MEKGASNWLTVIPVKDMDFNLNKRGIKLRYDWEITDNPSVCVCGDYFNVDHAMICRRGGFIIQRHNELCDIEPEMLNMVCNDVQIEPVLQETTGEVLTRGTNKAPDARLDIHARGFWERQRSAFFDVRVCHPNADSYKDLTLSKYIGSMKMRRSACTQAESWKSSKPPLRHWCLRQQEAWQKSAEDTTVD